MHISGAFRAHVTAEWLLEPNPICILVWCHWDAGVKYPDEVWNSGLSWIRCWGCGAMEKIPLEEIQGCSSSQPWIWCVTSWSWPFGTIRASHLQMSSSIGSPWWHQISQDTSLSKPGVVRPHKDVGALKTMNATSSPWLKSIPRLISSSSTLRFGAGFQFGNRRSGPSPAHAKKSRRGFSPALWTSWKPWQNQTFLCFISYNVSFPALRSRASSKCNTTVPPHNVVRYRNNLKPTEYPRFGHFYIWDFPFRSHKLQSKNKKTLTKVIHLLVKRSLRHVISSDWRSCYVPVSARKRDNYSSHISLRCVTNAFLMFPTPN